MALDFEWHRKNIAAARSIGDPEDLIDALKRSPGHGQFMATGTGPSSDSTSASERREFWRSAFLAATDIFPMDPARTDCQTAYQIADLALGEFDKRFGIPQ